MKKEASLILNKIGLMPISNKGWQTLQISHLKADKQGKKYTREFIKKKLGNVSGVYLYRNKAGRILYVGKGNPIKYRLYMHFRASFERVPGDTKNQRWHKFWSRHKGILKVYWTKLQKKQEQKLIEQMLEYVLLPKFITFSVEK